MLDILMTGRFRRDLKRIEKQGKDLNLLESVVDRLQQRQSLDIRHKDHNLKGNWKGCRECHLQPDWLLIYEVDLKISTLTLVRTGSHADLLDL